jgi:hypothetical protein
MWNAQCGCFDAGMAGDSKARNSTLALDAQIWPLLALPQNGARRDIVLKTLQERFATDGGMAYGAQKDGVWTEGTLQAVLLMELLGKPAQATALMAAAGKNRTPNGWYRAANRKTSTGFDLQTDLKQLRAYFPIPALAPLAWAALAEQGFNPFTGTRALPR